MQAHELADALQRAAIALENDAKLYQEFPKSRTAPLQRAKLWAHLSKLDRGVFLALSDLDARSLFVREQLRRYLADIWDCDEVLEPNVDCECMSTLKFWKPEVREPPKAKAKTAKAKTKLFPESLPEMAEKAYVNQSASNPQKETTMSKPIEITTKTLVNGIDVSTMTNAQVFDLIAEQEAAIKKLEGIDAKPQLLVKEIEDRKAGIAALVSYLDSQVK